MTNGKIDRQKLLDTFAKMQMNSIVNQDHLSIAEKALLCTVSSVTGTGLSTRIQLTDNFFDIGGNSLNAVDVVLQLNEQGYTIGNNYLLDPQR